MTTNKENPTAGDAAPLAMEDVYKRQGQKSLFEIVVYFESVLFNELNLFRCCEAEGNGVVIVDQRIAERIVFVRKFNGAL